MLIISLDLLVKNVDKLPYNVVACTRFLVVVTRQFQSIPIALQLAVSLIPAPLVPQYPWRFNNWTVLETHLLDAFIAGVLDAAKSKTVRAMGLVVSLNRRK